MQAQFRAELRLAASQDVMKAEINIKEQELVAEEIAHQEKNESDTRIRLLQLDCGINLKIMELNYLKQQCTELKQQLKSKHELNLSTNSLENQLESEQIRDEYQLKSFVEDRQINRDDKLLE